MIKQIQYTGYEAAAPDNLASDGSLSAAIGLVNKDGGMRVALRELRDAKEYIAYTSSAELLYVHKLSDGHTVYIVKDGGRSLLYWLNEEEYLNCRLYKENSLNVADWGKIKDVEAVGNTLVVIADEMHYLLWKNNAYTHLGTKVPNIDISFGIIGWHKCYDFEDVFSFDGNFTGPGDGSTTTFDDTQKKSASEAIYAKLNERIADQINEGYFCHPFFVRYAIVMYDGTIVNRSCPVFMTPSLTPIIEVTRIQYREPKTYFSVRVNFVSALLDYRIFNGTKEELKRWGDIIKSVDIFVSSPLYTYNQNGSIKSICATMSDKHFFYGRFMTDRFYFWDNDMNGGSWTSSNTDIIEPKDENDFQRLCYGAYSFTAMKLMNYVPIVDIYDNCQPCRTYLPLEEYSEEEINEKIEESHPCYRLFSIPIESLVEDDVEIENGNDWYRGKSQDFIDDVLQNPRGAFSRRIRIKPKNGIMKNLEQQGTIDTDTDYDYYDRDIILPEKAKIYNNAANIYGLKRKYNEPMLPTCLFQYRTVQSVTVKDYEDKKFHIEDTSIYTNKASILIEQDSKKIIIESEDIRSFRKYDIKDSIYGAYICVPYPNATAIFLSGATGVAKIELKKHHSLNAAFSSTGIKSTIKTGDVTQEELENLKSSCDPGKTVELKGLVYVSNTGNPFVYRPGRTVSFSGADIYGLETTTKALSQGQFGQFPMYAFTSDGIWAMEVSAETGAYKAKQPVSRDVCINQKSITQADNCIFFTTEKGIMMLSGSNVECISLKLDGNGAQNVSQILPKFKELFKMSDFENVDEYENTCDFKEFIKDAYISYDYKNGRLLIFQPSGSSYNFAYVCNLRNIEWSIIETKLSKTINGYPFSLAISGYCLKDVSSITDLDAESVPREGMLITRPLSLDAPEIHKTVDTIIQRGKFRKGCIKQVLWGSNDLIHWHLVASSNSHILRHVHGTPFKWFRVGVIATLKGDETLTGCSISYTPKLTNKLR